MERTGLFAGDDPIEITRAWLRKAEAHEPNDPNAMALASVDSDGMPNVRMVLLKEITDASFVFYTNYESNKGLELDQTQKAAFVLHWKSLKRQVRVRGNVEREDGDIADAYFALRSPESRIGAWASAQSQPLNSRDELLENVDNVEKTMGKTLQRPNFWGGYRLFPLEIEFWSDGAARLHDRFVWRRKNIDASWVVARLSP